VHTRLAPWLQKLEKCICQVVKVHVSNQDQLIDAVYARVSLFLSALVFLVFSIKMLPDPVQIKIPKSYETLPVTDVKVLHYPENAGEATPVVVVTLNRPKQGNAFTLQMMRDFELIYPMFDLDERVKCVVITGAGKMFCAGADLDIGFPSGGDRERPIDHRDS